MFWWFRENMNQAILFAFLFLVSWLGGWLLATHTLRVRGQERLVTGLATGLVLYTVLCNLLAHIIASNWAFSLAAFVVLGLGILSAWKSKRPWLHVSDFRHWMPLLAFFAIGMIFTLMLRGLTIWDDYINLPVVSTIAAGNLPPQYYLDPSLPFSYHYGLHVFAASLMSVGGFTSWSAWDIARGITTALAIVLAWLWFKRITRSTLSAHLSTILLSFGGGSLWLVSLFPGRIIYWLSDNVHLANSALNSGPSLATNLSGPFLFDGSPSLQIPFSFLGGILRPIIINWNATSSLYLVCVFLLLLGTRHLSWLSAIVVSLVLSLIALNAEYVYLLLIAGIGLAFLIAKVRSRRTKIPTKKWNWVIPTLALSFVFTLVQGGVITELAKNLIFHNNAGVESGLGTAGFSFQWPPSLVSTYFEPLSLFNPAQLIVGIADMGLVVLLIPIAAVWMWNCVKRNHILEAGFSLAGLLGLFIPLLVHYGVERDTSRITNFALQTFLIVSAPALAFLFRTGKVRLQSLIFFGFGMTIINGIVIFAILFTAITAPRITYFVDSSDATMSSNGWNRLAPESQILDYIPYRAVTLYGRFTHSSPASGPVDFSTYPEWQTLIQNPDPHDVALAGYDYIYMDNIWWDELSDQQQDAYDQACVVIAASVEDPNGEIWKRLMDVSACK